MVTPKTKHTMTLREFLGETAWLAEKARLRAVRSARHQRNQYRQKLRDWDCKLDY